MIELRFVDLPEHATFRTMVEAYWEELMPGAAVLKDVVSRDRYFNECFRWEGEQDRPYWALQGDEPVGFLSLSRRGQTAFIEDFYVAHGARRHGVGSVMLATLTSVMDGLGVTLIELNVRRDNPRALAFWQAMGFRIASYRLRQYRDPTTGTAFVGGLSSDFA